MKPLVSILIITYNHEPYISEAIESVLKQKVDFKIEIVIGDDFSTDNTREIILKYHQNFPDIIVPVFPQENQGPQPNFISTYGRCNGKYIGMLEGDDYWCDPEKLQRQVDFLERNHEFSICYTNNYWLLPNKVIEKKFTGKNGGKYLTVEDLLERNYVATQTCVFRNKLFELPSWFGDLYIGDWPLHIMNSLKGKVKHLDFYSAVYRVHENGIWSNLKTLHKEEHLVKMFEHILKVLPPIYYPKVYNLLKKKYYFLSLQYSREKNKGKSRFYFKKYFNLSNSIFEKDLLKLTTKVFLFH